MNGNETLEVSLRHHQQYVMCGSHEYDSHRFDDVSDSQDGFLSDDGLSLDEFQVAAARNGFSGDDPLSHPYIDGDAFETEEKLNREVGYRRCFQFSRTRCSSLVFVIFMVCAIGGIYAVWHLGIVGSFKNRGNQSSVSSASENEQRMQQAPMSPTTSPSNDPTMAPSESSFPTTSFPTRMPSITPQPSGSSLPSNFPSFQPSTIPSQPTMTPTSFPSAPTFQPTSLPTSIPSESYGSYGALTPPPTERVCNGLESNCNRRANEIMYATSHNAMSSQTDGFIAYNHLLSMEESMVAGFRGFLLDTCDCGEGGFKFCHELCVLGTREVAPLFTNIVSFLIDNPYEIFVIELQVNDDSLLGVWEQVPQEFIDLTYTHTSDSDPWPTLNQLIDLGQRVIVFQHNGPNCDEGECPEGLQGFWRYGFETNWDLSTVSDVEDFDLSCGIKTGIETRENTFMLNNHFSNSRVGLPSEGIAEIINAKDFLQERLDACTVLVGRRTNLLAVDFWSIGDVVDVVNIRNAALPDGEIVFDNIFEN